MLMAERDTSNAYVCAFVNVWVCEGEVYVLMRMRVLVRAIHGRCTTTRTLSY